MKIQGSLDIKKPQSIVAELFADPENLKEYQDGFQKKELVSGNMGQEGAVSIMYYKDKHRTMELTEIIISNKLPDSFEALYEHTQMDNVMKCQFIQISSNITRYEYEIEYTRINWFMPKLIAILFPGVYKNQVEKWMKQFKEFVEKQ
jgi:hypothetical protein